MRQTLFPEIQGRDTMETIRTAAADEGFDLLRNDLLLRWQRKLRIAPPQGLGVVRRAVFFALLTWLPIMIWAVLNDRVVHADTGEPLFMHFGIHVRCLVAIPLFILAEAMAGGVLRQIVGQFRTNNIISDKQQTGFTGLLDGMARLRDSSLPWIVVIGLAFIWILGNPVHSDSHELSWAAAGTDFGFGGWWFLYVAKPIFVILLLGWLWRIALVILLFQRIAKMELSLVPSHPDRCGGLGFLKKLPMALFLVTFAVSAIIASRWMHDVLYHAQTLASLKAPFAVFVVVWGALMLSPLLLFAPRIAAMKREALLSYGALIGTHGRLVHQRWILRQTVDSASAAGDILDAPELGPVVDISAIYDAVEKVTPLPIGKSSVMMVLVPIILPMLLVISQQIPIRDLLLKLLKTVV
jgi:hypothetical protein